MRSAGLALPLITMLLPAQEADPVFRSDVSLVRVDAQVLDRDQRAVTGLQANDFILREQGQPRPIRDFAAESMPVDILFLLDVSGSMRPHVERIASASREALRVLGPGDRVALMVFDRATRIRMPFRGSRQDLDPEFQSVVHQEMFNGGTDITRGLLDATDYVARHARPGSRRAIVILTDDQTERDRDEERVVRALTRADTVVSLLLAPNSLRNRQIPAGGTWPGGPLGGIILGRRGGPYGGPAGSRTHSAGTAEIARRSGGDSLAVDDGSALETTLARLRQKYALYFYLGDGVQPGQERDIEVELAGTAARRYPDAEVRFRRIYMGTGDAERSGEPVVISSRRSGRASDPVESGSLPERRRRRAVDERHGPVGPTSVGNESSPVAASPQSEPRVEQEGGWRRVDDPAGSGGWRPAKPRQ